MLGSLAAWRGLIEGDAIVREGRWRPTEKRITASLAGRHLGIVGLGAIGEAVARRAETFGLKVAWWSKLPENPLGRRIENEIRRWGVDTSGVIWDETPGTRAG